MKKFITTENDKGRTLLKFIESHYKEVPKHKIEKAFRNKDISLNGKRSKDKKYIIQNGDEIVVYGLEFKEKDKLYSAPITFTIVFEDENILVINKPAGVQMNDDKNSLDNQVLSYLKFKKVDSFIPSSIGRLDKVTSGLIIYGKNYKTVKEMKDKQKNFVKKYIFKSDIKKSSLQKVILHHDENTQREVVGKFGKEAITEFEISEIKVAKLITGRKHQIRATLAYLGFPIYGDLKYGGKKENRVYLHSYYILLKNLEGELEYLNNKEFINMPNW